MDDNSLPFLIEKICEAIALNENFPLLEIREGYQKLNSVDKLIEAIEGAKYHRVDLLEAIDGGYYVKTRVDEAIERSLPQVPSADRATISLGFDIRLGKNK